MIFIVSPRLLIGVGCGTLRWTGSFRSFGCCGTAVGRFAARTNIMTRTCLCPLGLSRCWSCLLILRPNVTGLRITLRLCITAATCCGIRCLAGWIFIVCSSRLLMRSRKDFCSLLFYRVFARYITFTFIYPLQKSFTFLCRIMEIQYQFQ